MALALLLTLLAMAGVALGVLLGKPRRLSNQLGAAGGGLLLGIAAFILIPEIAEELGWTGSLGLAFGVFIVLTGLDRALMHGGYSLREGVAAPLIAVTAIHSFLDGWSVRAAAIGPVVNIAVPLGLALHKIPEGLALGWITKRRYSSTQRAIWCGCAAEFLTLAGAYSEPRLQRAGVHHFGFWWPAFVLAGIAGTFFFLGMHALWPVRQERGVLVVFLATLLTVGAVASFR
jgi:hypothetical protein